MISLKEYEKGKVTLTAFIDSIRENLPNEVYFLPSREEMAWECLRKMGIKKLEKSSASISAICKRINDVESFLKDIDGDPVDIFAKVFLNIKLLPITVKMSLEKEVKKHLQHLEVLLDHYKQLPIVIKNSVDPEKPRNHDERTQLEFFRRTVSKKENIVQYLTSGALDARAIDKSTVGFKEFHNEGTKNIEKQIMFQTDFPYSDLLINNNKIEFGIDFEKLDYRLINTIRNKRSWVKGEYDRAGYSTKFNKAVKSSIDPKKFFKGVMKDLKSVPIVANRQPLFKELRELFFNKHWYGFYALALPQVEGIFNEMVELVNLKKSSGTLTDKVHLVRPYYENSEFYFDYYEYFLPNWRNHFAHTGKVQDAEIKCYYLMLDIKDLLITCVSLNSPVSRIAAIIKQGADGLSHIGDLSELILLINDIQAQKQMELIEKELTRFIYKDVAVNIDLKIFFEKLQADFNMALRKFEYHLELGMHSTRDPGIKLFQLKPSEVIANITLIEKSYEAYYFLMDEDLKLLLDTNNVLHYFDKYFPKLPTLILDELNNFKAKYESEFKTLSMLNAKAKFDLPDDYLLHKRTMSHVLN